MKNPNTDSPAISAIDLLLNDFHKAMTKADGASTPAIFIKTPFFLGPTKPSMDLELSNPAAYLTRAKALSAQQRHIALSPDGNTAWFDEQLPT